VINSGGVSNKAPPCKKISIPTQAAYSKGVTGTITPIPVSVSASRHYTLLFQWFDVLVVWNLVWLDVLVVWNLVWLDVPLALYCHVCLRAGLGSSIQKRCSSELRPMFPGVPLLPLSLHITDPCPVESMMRNSSTIQSARSANASSMASKFTWTRTKTSGRASQAVTVRLIGHSRRAG